MEELNFKYHPSNVDEMPRLVQKVFNLDEEEERNSFFKDYSKTLPIPGTERTISYDPLPRLAIATSSRGANESIALAALYILLNRVSQAQLQASTNPDPYSPWHQVNGWRSNEKNVHDLEFIDIHHQQSTGSDNSELSSIIKASIHFKKEGFMIEVNDRTYSASGTLDNEQLSANLSGQRIDAQVIEHDEKLHILTHGKSVVLGFKDHEHQTTDHDNSGNLTAPMPGTVVAVKVQVGDKVTQNQPLLILEAMKIEHTISAPSNGVISEILYDAGEMVEDGVELIVIDADS